jgi:hypothetical protein
MYKIENRSKNPRVFLDQHGRAVTIGVNMERELDLDENTANFVQAQIDRDDELSGREGTSGIRISGSAEAPPSEKPKAGRGGRVKITGGGNEQQLPGEGEPVSDKGKGGGSRRKKGGRSRVKAKDDDKGEGGEGEAGE